jgi:hypothetical protein
VPRISTRTRPKIPAIPGKSHSTRIAEAYEKLGITENECNRLPKITHILRNLPGKVDQAIEFLRGSNESDAQKWLQVYDSLGISIRKLLPFEAFCAASGLSTKRVLELVTGACFEQSDAVAALLSKAAKPVILQKAIKLAVKPKQWEDRKMIMQHEGYAPIPKTQVVNVQGDVNTDNRQQSVSIGSLNKIDAIMGEITDRFNERLSIGDGRNSSARQITEAIEEVEANDDIIDNDNDIDPGSAIGNIVEIPELADGLVINDSVPDRTENGSEWEVDL